MNEVVEEQVEAPEQKAEEPNIVEVAKMYLIAQADGQILGVDWAWSDHINAPEHGIIAIQNLKNAVNDVGWSTRVIMACGQKPEEKTEEPVDEVE